MPSFGHPFSDFSVAQLKKASRFLFDETLHVERRGPQSLEHEPLFEKVPSRTRSVLGGRGNERSRRHGGRSVRGRPSSFVLSPRRRATKRPRPRVRSVGVVPLNRAEPWAAAGASYCPKTHTKKKEVEIRKVCFVSEAFSSLPTRHAIGGSLVHPADCSAGDDGTNLAPSISSPEKTVGVVHRVGGSPFQVELANGKGYGPDEPIGASE